MSTCTHIWTWLSAARSEALLARHPRIEETDLLLGLLAQGGPVARTLGAAGVGLARARSAATDLDDADLAGANIPVPRGLRPQRLLVSLAVVQADVDLDLAPGAEDVVLMASNRNEYIEFPEGFKFTTNLEDTLKNDKIGRAHV